MMDAAQRPRYHAAASAMNLIDNDVMSEEAQPLTDYIDTSFSLSSRHCRERYQDTSNSKKTREDRDFLDPYPMNFDELPPSCISFYNHHYIDTCYGL
jgi:hypothetical protein